MATRACPRCHVFKDESDFQGRRHCAKCREYARNYKRPIREAPPFAVPAAPAPVPAVPADPADAVRIDVEPPPPDTREQLAIARLRLEKSRLQAQVKNLEKLALTGDALRELIGGLGAPTVNANPEWLRGAAEKKSVTGTAVLFVSDIHFDEVVSAAQVGGSNEYNREIATQRIKNTFRSAIVLLKAFMAAPRYEGIVCPLGGDLLSGNIHEELQQTNEYPIQQSMLALEEILIEGLGGLADEFGKVHVPCVVGNHGRMTRKPQAKNRAFESYEWPIYQRIAAYFRKDSRLTFDIPDGPDAFFSIYGTRFCLTHGDQFRGGDGVGGILVPIGRGLSRKQFRQQAMGDPFDVMMIGHWHQYIQLSNLIINGSIKGMDEYAYQGNFAFQEPEQALFVVHPDVGITARWPVKCAYVGGKAAKVGAG